MDTFPSEFSDVLSARGLDLLEGRGGPLPADLRKDNEHFFVLPGALDEEKAQACLTGLERDFEGKLGSISAPIPPESIAEATRNFTDSLRKTMHVRSVIFDDPSKELQQIAEQDGLLPMLRSESLRLFAEAMTGLTLEGGWGSQVICYSHGDYVGPHTDHFPEFDWAKDGYVDIQFTFVNDAVGQQWFVHESGGFLSKVWDINLMGAVTVFRQPFWHYTTPLLGKKGREPEARRWLIGQVFRIRTPRPSSMPGGSEPTERVSQGGSQSERVTSDAPLRVLERNQRLSESILWQWQRRFYAEQGIGAWRRGTVPSRITTNSFIATAYARLISAFIRDRQLAKSSTSSRRRVEQPFYVLELGAGSGRLAYLISKNLLSEESLGTSFSYVMSDMAEANVNGWMRNPRLRPLIEGGHVDCAVYDATSGGPIELLSSGTALSAGSLEKPLVVIANYFFDSIEQDLFKVQAGRLHEGRLTVRSSDLGDPDRSGVNMLENCKVDFAYQPIDGHVYDDDEWNEILRTYKEKLGDSTFLFPIGAFRSLRGLLALAGRDMLVLAADKGHLSIEALQGAEDPMFAVHGSVSFEVNFDALAAYCQRAGGFSMSTSGDRSALAIQAMVWGTPSTSLPQTVRTFRDGIARFSALDCHKLLDALTTENGSLDIDQLRALIRLSAEDPQIVCRLAPLLRDRISELPTRAQAEIVNLLDEAWTNHFPLGDPVDPAFEIATVFQVMGLPSKAVEYYQRSMAEHGEHFTTLHNLGLCHVDLGQEAAALRLFERVVALEPGFFRAREWRDRLSRRLRAPQSLAVHSSSTDADETSANDDRDNGGAR